jgi:hypothetical protein
VAPRTDWLSALREWHQAKGLDLGALFEERPDLFRALLESPQQLRENDLGRDYMKAAKRTAARASTAQVYRSMFATAAEPLSPKQERVIGVLASARKHEHSTRRPAAAKAARRRQKHRRPKKHQGRD